jgi:hypothetical protein
MNNAANTGTATEAQKARNACRTNGRFRGNKCECCKKPAPMDYFSAGNYVILCEKCADKVESEL